MTQRTHRVPPRPGCNNCSLKATYYGGRRQRRTSHTCVTTRTVIDRIFTCTTCEDTRSRNTAMVIWPSLVMILKGSCHEIRRLNKLNRRDSQRKSMRLLAMVPHSKNRRDGWTYTCLTMGLIVTVPHSKNRRDGWTYTCLTMGLLAMVTHSKNRRDGWTYTCLTHGTDSDSPTQQEQAWWLDIHLSYTCDC